MWQSLYDSLCGAHISAKVSEYVQIIKNLIILIKLIII